MDISESQNPLDTVDSRTRLAGSNQMEILLFSLGGRETFGVNVFKVREVTKAPTITRTPNLPAGVEGVIPLRGNIIPVINLLKFVRQGNAPSEPATVMMIAEYSRHTQGFLVQSVDRIVRVPWDRVKGPEGMLAGNDKLITAITELPDGELVSILDVEQVLADAFGEEPVPEIAPVKGSHEAELFFVDDSAVARKLIIQVLDKLTVKYRQATNGREAWDRLQGLAGHALRDGVNLRDRLRLILVDAEMPEMDGYVLTKRIKADPRFAGIPVVMHSSLSSQANRAMGAGVGVDAYVAKFDAHALAETMRPLLAAEPESS